MINDFKFKRYTGDTKRIYSYKNLKPDITINVESYLNIIMKNIKEKMLEKNISIKELADLICVDCDKLDNYLNINIGDMSSDIIILIAMALNSSPNELMGCGKK